MTSRPGDQAGQIRKLEAQLARSQARYEALRNRRSVRSALALAGMVARAKRLADRRTAPPAAVPEAALEPELRPASTLPWNTILELLEVAPEVSVLVPVHDAFEAFERCIEHLARNTSTAREIVVIDDASEDPRIAALLGSLSATKGFRVLHNSENLGFVRTVNRGFAEIEGDVIVLNSDTAVPPRWVERLRWAAYSGSDVASATAISDNAGAFSAPAAGDARHLADLGGADGVGRRVTRRSGWRLPDTPTGNGFCMYLKRSALDDVGLFDAEKYPRGYGEENDWSMRARAAGWRHVVDDTTYVVHQRMASFGEEREALSAAGTARLRWDFPEFAFLAHAFVGSEAMAEVRWSAADALSRWDEPVRPRVLFVLHDMGGGTPRTNRDLLAGLADRYEGFVLISDARHLRLSDGEGTVIDEVALDHELWIDDVDHPGYRQALAGMLARHDIDVVHIRHLLKHSLAVPRVAQAMGIPVVLSVHDYYLVCPTSHLMDDQDRFCGGTCTPGQGTCLAAPWVRQGPHLKHGWVHAWRRRVSRMLEDVDVMVAASEMAAEFHRTAPDLPLADARWEVIEHGRNLTRQDAGRFPAEGEPIRLLLAGDIGPHKGADLVRELARIDTERRLEFHIVGTIRGEVPETVKVYGSYARDEFGAIVEEIRPAAMALLSLTAETYSHTLTEGWAAGLPVFVTDLGAPQDRVAAHGGGWVIATDPEAAYRRILEVFSDRVGYEQRRREALTASWPDVATMANRYADLYDELRSARGTVRPPAA